jgi:predicted PurR-regulated permease PerM
MSKTVRINPLLVFFAVLVGASAGNLIGGIFGLVTALMATPIAGALQVRAVVFATNSARRLSVVFRLLARKAEAR